MMLSPGAGDPQSNSKLLQSSSHKQLLPKPPLSLSSVVQETNTMIEKELEEYRNIDRR